MRQTRIYADHAATTALSPAALEAMLPWLREGYGNPSALYGLAREAHRAVSSAREDVADILGASPEELYFTSGGTEADNWALKGMAYPLSPGKQLVTSAIEHHAVLHTCDALAQQGMRIVKLPVDGEGLVSTGALEEALREDTTLVSVMLANNEIGTIEPIRQLAELAHARGVPFHTDAVQALGHIPVRMEELQIDLLSASAHKFNGPKGVGFLYVRKGTKPVPLLDGGGQERGMRSGTENVSGIVGMATALREHATQLEAEAAQLNRLSQRLLEQLRAYGLDFLVNGSAHRIPGSLSLSFRGAEGETLLHRLDLMGTAVATGSACNSRETELSHVIRAIHVPEEYAGGTIRITFGPENSEEQANQIAAQLAKILLNP